MRAGAIAAIIATLAWLVPEASARRDKPWLGVIIATNCPVRTLPDGSTYKRPGCRDGVRVVRILPDTPAQRAQLHPSDVITRVSGVAVSQASELITEISTRHRVGDVAVLDVLRGGSAIRIQATLDAMLSPSELFAKEHVGKAAREVGNLAQVSGDKSSSAIGDHRGDVVVVYLFSRACPRCAAISRVVDELHLRYGDRGLSVLAFAEEDRAPVAALVRAQELGMPVFADPFHRARRAFGITGPLPAVLVIGRDGVVRHAALADEIEVAALRAAVDRALRRAAAVR